MSSGVLKTCQKCGRSLDEELQFYLRKNGTRADLCKKCLTMHVDNYDPETFLWILKDMDVPYVPEEWNILRDRAFAKNPNLNGTSVLGKYLSKMKLKQWRDFSWEDSEKLQALNEEKRTINKVERAEYENHLKEQLEDGEITEAQYKTLVSTETQMKDSLYAIPDFQDAAMNPFANPNDFIDEEQLDLVKDLTDDDKIYLAMKWGRLYKPNEWITLEKLYKDMMTSFDIHDADTIATLILICKTNLKMNQALDSGDNDSFQKFSKTYNDLRKSAKFTAAQNKEQKGDFVDSVGELVAYCEKCGGAIPKYTIDTPMDIVDKVIADLKNYTKELVYEDKSLAKQIEDYLKKTEISKQKKQDLKEAEEKGLDYVELDDEDFSEYQDHLKNLAEQDNLIYEGEVDE